MPALNHAIERHCRLAGNARIKCPLIRFGLHVSAPVASINDNVILCVWVGTPAYAFGDLAPVAGLVTMGAGGGVHVLHGEGSGYWHHLVSTAKSLTWDASGPGDRSQWLSSNTECARGIFPLLKVHWKGKNDAGYVQRANS